MQVSAFHPKLLLLIKEIALSVSLDGTCAWWRFTLFELILDLSKVFSYSFTLLSCSVFYFESSLVSTSESNCKLVSSVSPTSSIKTLYFLISHCKCLESNCWPCLHKSNHGFITVRVKFGIISFRNLVELLYAILNWI